MKTHQLGQSELFVSEIGLGSMSLPENHQDGVYMIQKAIDEGVNFVDTADLYRFGNVETTVGEALKGRREDVILATKGGNHWEAGKENWHWDPSKAYIKEACKQSLKRLGTDYIDLYQLHGGTIDDPIDETIAAFEELKQEGYIRCYGISSIRPNVIREYVHRSNIVSVMMQYSILDRRPEETVLPLLAENNISVITRGPVGKGILSDNGENKIPENGYLDYSAEELQEIVKQLQQQTSGNRPLSQTAIRYALHHPAVAAAIPGASKPSQLENNIQTSVSPELSAKELAAIQSISKANKYDNHR
ncbi:aldo/keto reductase [Tuberibacillus sp. Marseille-P3662]|uniref:aldo/keto reductase n=1 Tax=Tuberibacillus sp. Marseille-P3662 TaxID=1965358 RepID=UPI000A1C8784|nr:aldo/keto reductase [Tuberibacillus sp. Marseille-P3662]